MTFSPWEHSISIPEVALSASNDPAYMDQGHVGLTRMSMIFFHNISVLEKGFDATGES